jgi:PAS domain S-box-containing protein
MKIKTLLNATSSVSIEVILVMIASFVWSFLQIRNANEAMALASEIRNVILQRSVLRDEYYIYREVRARIQWQRKSEQLGELLRSVSAKSSTREEREICAEMLESHDHTLIFFNKLLAINDKQKTESSNPTLLEDYEKRLFSQLMLKSYALADGAVKLLDLREKEVRSAHGQSTLLLALCLCLLTSTVIVNGFLISRILKHRIGQLRKGTEIIGGGNLDYRIDTRADDEISELARETNAMAAKLKQSCTSIENLRTEVAERKKAESELRASEASYRALHESMMDAFVRVDMSGRIVEFNGAYKHMLGYSEGELLSLSYQKLTPAKWHDFEARIVEEQIMKRGYSEVYEKEYRRKDGTVFPIELRASLLRDSAGKPLNIWAIVREISTRKAMEAELKTLNADLERRVAERTAELEASNTELEAFSHTVSHDLRAPLRHIHGYADLLSSYLGNGLSEQGRHYLDTISDATRQMGQLIDDLLQFSKTGRLEVHRAGCDMQRTVNEILASLEPDCAGREIRWILGNLPQVQGDCAMLRQVWTNLLANAVKYTRKKQEARIEVGVREEGDELICFVRDNGVGFDMQYADNLFGVFQRMHSPDEFEGTGIGLATVRRIVARHGGRTWAEAAPDKGATFYFSLPRSFNV